MSATVPNHIGLILDGNRRWAKSQGMPAFQGHRVGADNIKTISLAAYDRGVSVVSAFVFSTENWKRAKEEIDYILDLSMKLIVRELDEVYSRGIRLVWIGSEDGVSKKLIKAFRDAEAKTKDNKKGILCFCFNYGGYREITDAIAAVVRDGIKEPTEKDVAERLYGGNLVPDIDLLIRTSGEQRISNFMLWRAAYAELLFVKQPWPAFTVEDLDDAIAEFAARNRRFGE